MKIFAIVVLSLLLIFLGVQVVSFIKQERELNSDFTTVESQLTKAQADETALQEQNDYLQNPANLEKELRANFNYKKPGETMVIIVPGPTSTTSTD